MNNRRSYLDAINAGRRRRPSTSLEQLSNTLDELESRIGGRSRDDRDDARPLPGRSSQTGSYRYEAPTADRWQASAPARDDRRVADELNALRDELRHQMGSGLRREFGALKGEIENALRTSGANGQAAELGVEFERLSAMIHKLAEQSDDRQVNLLRLEMEEVKGALGKLAREETMQGFDRRWDEFDRRWSDIASKVSAPREADAASDRALQALTQRLEQIADAVEALPTSVTLRSLEEKMKILATTVDQFAHHQDRIGPEALDAIEERLNEISRAVAASTAVAHPAALDPEPFERIEARISSLARQLGEVVEDNPATALAEQLAALGHRVEDLARRVDVPDHTIARLADQIEIISRKLDDGPAHRDIDHVFHGLESRFVSLSTLLEQRHEDALAQGQSLFRDLENRLADVAGRIESRNESGPAQDAHLLQAMDDRFTELASRLERQQAAATATSASLSSTNGVDPDLIRSLEAQIAGLAAHIAQPSASAVENAIRPRLDKIEQSITDSRQDVIEAARRAAEDAVRSFSGSAGEGAVVAGLAEDLKSLEALTRRSDDRNAKTFEAIHDTLLKIVERLGTLEDTRVAASQTAVRDRNTLASTPSIDPAASDFPLSDIDDDSATDRPRNAAMAAAEAAADAVRSEPVSETESGKRSMLGGLTRAFSGRRGKKGKDEQSSETSPAMPAASQLDFDAPTVDVDMPLDPQFANQPLEPGSGAPDLNAIMKRVRDERGQPARGADSDTAKSDFIAAARRAAQAAAAEAEMMKRNPGKKDKASAAGLGRLLGGRRKPLLMGVAAVLIALAALQGARSMLGGSGDELAGLQANPSPEQTASVPVASAIADDPLPAVEIEPVQTVRVVDDRETASSARSMLATAPESAEDVTTSWLDTPAATALPAEPAEEIVSAQLDETVELPAPSEEMLAAIPVTAGPIALREAAAAGDPKALFEIGNRYAEGRGVTENMATAVEWYEKAAENGLAPAQYRLGNFLEKGMGVTRDVEKAKTWYQLAAGQGNASAMHNLAVLHAMGADGVTDNESAARWFVEAAELGVRDSQFNLGILSAKGVGVQQNLEEAYKWFAIVAKAGDRDAAEKRDEVASALSADQLENARAAAELWRARPVDPEANSVEIPQSWGESADITASVDMRQALRNIQQILNANGYDAGTEDGLMGQRTHAAIAKFQSDNGMEPTGNVDEPLVKALLERR